MKNLAVIIFLFHLISMGYAAVPTLNASDYSWRNKYTGRAMDHLTWISSAATSTQQIQALKGLQQFAKGGKVLCELCNPQEMEDLRITLEKIDEGLCEAFSQMMKKLTGLQQQYSSLVQIQKALLNNPAEASLALQQASLQSQITIQQTLHEMEAIQIQQIQKTLVEEKIQNQARNSMWTGIKGVN